jgi:GGDEF domain-containing protein
VSGPWDELAAEAPSSEDRERTSGVSTSQALVAAQPSPAAPAAPSWAELAKDAPTTQDLLADPARAAQVADDVQGLSFLEAVFRGSGSLLAGGIGEALYRGRLNDEISVIGYRQAIGVATPEEIARAETLELLAASVPRPKTGLVARGLRAAAESAPMMVGSAWEGGPLAIAGGSIGAIVGGVGGAIASGGPGVVPGAIAGAKFGASVGGRAGMTVATGKREMGSAFREYSRIPGVTPEQATFAAAIVGAANGMLEVLPLDIVFQLPALKTLVKGGIAKDFFRSALKSNTGRAAVARAAARVAGGMTLEGLTEAMQELNTILGGELIDEKTGVSIDWNRVGEAGLEGGLAGGVYGAPGVAAGLRSDVTEASHARERAQFFTALGEAAAESKTVANLPDVARAHVEAIQARQGGAVESVSAPAEQLLTLFQANDISLEQVARRMPAVARQIEEAAGNPAVEITIPTADFAVNVAPLKGYEGLVPDLRVGDELTLREAEKVEKEAKQLAAATAKADAKPAPATPEQRVLADVASKLEAAGQDAETARLNAALWAAFSRTMAARTGKGDAFSFYEGLGLQVEQQELGPLQAPGLEVTRSSELLTKHLVGLDRPGKESLFFTDPNTGALNRRAFEALPADPARPLVAHISVEGTKWANKSGHATGNLLYRAAAKALRGAAPLVAKVGGDFAVRVKDQAQLTAILEKAQAAMPEGIALTAELGPDLETAGKTHAGTKKGLEGAGKRALRGAKPLGAKVETAAEMGLSAEELAPADVPAEIRALLPNDEAAFKAAFLDGNGALTGEGFFLLEKLDKAAHVASIDLNGLRAINERFGEEFGDQMLRAVSRQAAKAYGAEFDFAHLSGDEYAARSNDPKALQAFVDDLAELCATITHEDDTPAAVTFGYGIGETYDAADSLVEGDKLLGPEVEAAARASRLEGRRGDGAQGQRADQPRRVRRQGFAGGRAVLREAAQVAGQTSLEQPPSREGAEPRGRVTFPESREWFRVTLTGSANLSTFVHESGHVFLEVLRQTAEKDPGLKADLAAIHQWLGVPLSGEFTTDQLERFARGFETYLREGRAPAPGLVEVFDSMKAWLLHVYRTLRGLDVELTDEVRGVMDRLLATETEIAQARHNAGLLPIASAELAGMSEAEYAAYRERFEKGAAAAQAEVERDSLSALTRTLGEERAAVRTDMEELATLEPVFNLREFLRTGARLDGVEVDEAIAGAKLDRASLEGLTDPKGMRRLAPFVAAEGGFSADDLAPYFGFKDGHELVQALVTTPRREAWVKAETDRRMAERYPDSVIANLAKQAVAAVQQNDGIVRALRDELDAVGRRVGAGPARSAIEVLRRAARERAVQMTDLELRPDKYRRAEAASAREFLEHLAGKRYAEAHDAKRRQLWNHFMAAETAKAKKEGERIRSYLRGLEDVGTLRRIGKAGQRYVEAIRALIDGIQLRKESGKAVRKRASLARYVAEMEAEGDTISPALKELGELKSWRSMTIEELQGVEAAAANIEAMARLKGKLLLGGEKRDLARTAAELSGHVRTNLGTESKPTPGDLGKLEKAREWLRSADADMKKVEFICRILDGGKTAGLAHSLIFQPLRDAQNARNAMNEQVHGALMKPFQELTLARRKRYAEKVGFLYSPKAGKMVTLTRRNLLAILLNLGNAGNAERLLAGYGWTREAVLARLDQFLDDGDLAIVEHIWKTVDSLWPAMKGLSERHVGLPPPRVEATPFQLPGGRKLSGGYYPIVKSRRMSYLGQQLAEREAALWEANFFAPVVEHGFTRSRGKDLSPLELSLDVVPAHLDKVIHYLTHYEAIRGVDRLLQQGDVREAITEGLGREYFNGFRPWLENIASDGNLAEPLVWYERVFRHLRFGSSVVLLFGKLPTGVKQALGLFTSGKEVQRRHMVSGLRKFLREGWAEVREQSPEFKFIDKQLDRDARELFTALESSFTELGGLKRKVIEFGAMPIMLVQKTVNAITWYGAKEQALEEGHANPNAYADAVVSMTQTGGGAKDLAAIQRGGELRKLFTVMFSYRSVLYNLLTERTGKTGGKAALEYAARFWWLVFLPVVAEQLLMNGVGDDEDADDVAKRLLLEMALLPVSTVPVVGDAVQGAVQHRPPRGAPWLDTIYRSVVTAGKVVQGEDLGKADARAVVDLVGSTMQLPTGGLWNLGLFTDELLSGELEEPVQDLLFRNPSKWE